MAEVGCRGGTAKDFSDETIHNDTEYLTRLERSWIVLNEKELRLKAKFGTQPLTKPFEAIPQMLVPKEDEPGMFETVFCFRDPEQPYRRAFTEVVVKDTKRRKSLEANQTLWSGQANAYQREACFGRLDLAHLIMALCQAYSR